MAVGKTASGLILACALWGTDMEFQVRHQHLRKGCVGTMKVTSEGIAFAGSKNHAWTWKYADIQELKAAPERISVLTYEDRKLKLGADRAYEFQGEIPSGVYTLWSAKLDQRFVEARAEETGGWSLAAKHLRPVSGSDGILTFGASRIVYATDARDDSRTWRYQDIDTISSSGPFQLTITSFERARALYGDRKGFNFQLKQVLSEAQYNQLWLDIQKANGRIQ
jgi:hypothetical protein